jgi:chlorobactene glucosyltransferase
VSLVVAAKDEAAGIAACVRSLLSQDYPNLQVIIVDDRSADGTAEAARAAGAGDPRLTVVSVKELPAGWFGKAHAVHVGLSHADGDWFCLTDADCLFHDRRLVSAAVAMATGGGADGDGDGGADFLTLLPMIDMPHWWQRLADPIACGVILLCFDPRKANDPADPSAAAFAGFMLIRRSAHAGFGGHGTVAGTLGEDVALGRAAKAAGFRLRVARHDRLFTTASYPTPAASFRGWSRVLFAAMATPARVAVQLLLTLALSLGPYFLLLGSLAAGLSGLRDWSDPEFTRLLWASAAAVVGETLAVGQFYRWCGAPGSLALAYLGTSFWLTAVLVHALLRFRSGAGLNWRGTVYPAANAGAATGVGDGAKSPAGATRRDSPPTP